MVKNQKANEKYYNNISEKYDEKHLIDMSDYSFFCRQMRRLLQPDALNSSTKIIDCGCGTGRGALKFSKLGCDVTAVDISANIVDACRSNAEKLGYKINTSIEDCHHLSFDSNCFDAVTLSAALHHMEDVEQCLQEFYRIIKPGGMLILIAEPQQSKIRPQWIRRKKDYLSNRYDKKVSALTPMQTNPDVHIFDLNVLKSNLENLGYTKIKVQHFFLLSSLYRDLLFFRLRNKTLRKGLLMLFQWLDEMFLFWLPNNCYALFNLVAYKPH